MGKRILITPLDWGLGHATRCIPIIQELLDQGNEVMIASSGLALNLLKEEFPRLTFFELPSYKATYAKWLPLMIKVFWQSPYFFYVISKEHTVVKKIIDDYKIDVIISDNRYGCYSEKVKSIFITHQLTILMPKGLVWLQGLINYFNHNLIKRFDTCWVPDFPDQRLTGKLTITSLPVFFIGSVSRFTKSPPNPVKLYQLLILLSGPEPQRTLLEDKLIHQLENYQGKVMVVRGLPGVLTNILPHPAHVEVVNHLKAGELQQVIEKSEIIISRSGYTTIMDLYALESKAIFIATPGQTEQEYLAEKLKQANVVYSDNQDRFNLKEAIDKEKSYKGFQQSELGRQFLLDAIRMMS
ncbi:glycosyl transferase [Chryseotalea sanaruensis]|uniref:Glycosyl transferase n=1 Tax=Chryseotalea sanaruensis TaxID=2482724 RepID=A0A401U9W3_9BACT|nr:glycosyltransferase [Chryseotalea sanaruensis]GCC51696.1 glycosyl transferase [Chryseotalea sanaruensis]